MPPRSLALTWSRAPLWRSACVAWWNAGRAWWAALRARRIAAQELRAMGERECQDLGIGRGDIEFLLRVPPAHRPRTAGRPTGPRRRPPQPGVRPACRGWRPPQRG